VKSKVGKGQTISMFLTSCILSILQMVYFGLIIIGSFKPPLNFPINFPIKLFSGPKFN